MPSTLHVITVAGLIGFAAVASATEPSQEHSDRLANLVIQDCGSCHGLTMKGGLGRPITPDALKAMDVETLTGIVLDGVPGTAMPPWRGMVSDADARWIAEGLKEGRFQ